MQRSFLFVKVKGMQKSHVRYTERAGKGFRVSKLESL